MESILQLITSSTARSYVLQFVATTGALPFALFFSYIGAISKDRIWIGIAVLGWGWLISSSFFAFSYALGDAFYTILKSPLPNFSSLTMWLGSWITMWVVYTQYFRK